MIRKLIQQQGIVLILIGMLLVFAASYTRLSYSPELIAHAANHSLGGALLSFVETLAARGSSPHKVLYSQNRIRHNCLHGHGHPQAA